MLMFAGEVRGVRLGPCDYTHERSRADELHGVRTNMDTEGVHEQGKNHETYDSRCFMSEAESGREMDT
eukprot:6173178-Pleurochrysis_carterae.AAC.2